MRSATTLETRLGRLLGAGSVASTVLLAIGLVFHLALPGGRPASALLAAGLITLMVTPAARVAAAMVAYLVDRDWTFALMAATVLIVLIVSVVFAAG